MTSFPLRNAPSLCSSQSRSYPLPSAPLLRLHSVLLLSPIGPMSVPDKHPLAQPFLAATGSAPNSPAASRSTPVPHASSSLVPAPPLSLWMGLALPRHWLPALPLFQLPIRTLLPCTLLLPLFARIP